MQFNFTFLCLLFLSMAFNSTFAQEINLTHSMVMDMAEKKSSDALIAKSNYHIATLDQLDFEATRKPNVTLSLTPVTFNENIVQRYLSDVDRDVYRAQKNLYNYSQLSVTQLIGFTGGVVSLSSNLSINNTYGFQRYKQFASVPFLFSYKQNLLGYNEYKWTKKLKSHEKEKAGYVFCSSIESARANASNLYFSVLLAQKEMELARQDRVFYDSLLIIGEKKMRLGRISRQELLTIKAEGLNSSTYVLEANSSLKRAQYELCDYIGISRDTLLTALAPLCPSSKLVSKQEVVQYALRCAPYKLEREIEILNALQGVDKAKKQRFIDASLSLSVGVNQIGEDFYEAYTHPLRQEMVSVTMTIPVLDWNTRKRAVQRAKEILYQVELSNKEKTDKIELDAIELYNSFVIAVKNHDASAEREQVYRQMLDGMVYSFSVGKETLENLLRSYRHLKQAQLEYLKALKNCWMLYHQLRITTLYDWENLRPIEHNCEQ